jgi:DNA-binding HxlR family transcriptional regulator
MATHYGHFCPVARALEKIGDKWSLLIVRDLLRKPQRFTDLKTYLTGITPKWLISRLRELEAAGIVRHERQPGRREIWYELTPAGRDLAPIMDALATWGIRHAMRPPLPGEVVHPDLLVNALVKSLNKAEKHLPESRRWSIRFPQAAYVVSYHDNNWIECKGEEEKTDLTITTTPETWATLATVPRNERSRVINTMDIQGKPGRVKEFLNLYGIRNSRE